MTKIVLEGVAFVSGGGWVIIRGYYNSLDHMIKEVFMNHIPREERETGEGHLRTRRLRITIEEVEDE